MKKPIYTNFTSNRPKNTKSLLKFICTN